MSTRPSPAAAQQAPTTTGTTETANDAPLRYVLDNGLCVILQQAPQPGLFSAQLWVKTGSIHEGDLLGCGVSHYLEHMLFKGTARRGPLDISAEINHLGGYVNAYTTFDRTVYYIDGPGEATEQALDILLDMGFHAALPPEEALRERDVILREIDMGLDDPDRRLMQAFTQTAFREHPYRHPIIGWRELFEQVSPADLRDYYEHRYSTDNAVLVIVSDREPQALQQTIAELAGKIRRRRVHPVSILPEPPQLSQRQLRLEGDSQIVRGMMGYRIPGLSSPQAPWLDVLNRLLGGGQSSLLWQALREEQKLVHHISSGCWNPGSQGLLWINYTCDPGKREQVEDAIRTTLQTAQATAFDTEQVAKVVRQATVAELNSRRTATGIAARLGAAEVVLGDLDYPRRHLELLRATSPEQVTQAACRYLQPHSETTVSMEAQPPALAKSAANVRQQNTGSTGSKANAFETLTLPNGARLLLQEDKSLPKVHFRFGALGGGLWEHPHQRGATGVLASLLTRETTKRSAAQVAAQIEQIGGSFNEFTGNNSFGIGIEVLSEDTALALDLLEQALLHRNSGETSFQLERDGQLAALLEEEDELLDWGRRRLREQCFGSHPYATGYLGREADLQALRLDDINTLAATLLRGPNAVLAVSGQFDRDRVKDALSQTLGALPGGALPAPILPAGATTTLPAATARLKREREQAIILVGYPDVGTRAQTQFIVGELLDEIFSGMSSRLFRRVRDEQGLAYYVGSERMSGLDRGLFTFYAGTHPDHVERVLEAINEETRRATGGGITTEELTTAKLRLRVRQRQSRQLAGSRALQSVLSTLYDKGANAWQNYDAAVEAVSLDALHAFATAHFDAATNQTLIVTP